MPPEARLSRAPEARVRSAPPSMVSEFGATLVAKVVVALAEVKSRFLSVTLLLKSDSYSEGLRSRTIRSAESDVPPPPALSTVANEKPSGCAVRPDRPMTAQGRMPLVATPMPPFAPLMVTPPAKTTLLRPGSFETPNRSSPRKRTEEPCGDELWIGAILSGALLKTKVILPA